MKNEIKYLGRTIIEGTNGLFTAYPSNHNSYSARSFKTIGGAKTYIAGKLNSYNFVNAN